MKKPTLTSELAAAGLTLALAAALWFVLSVGGSNRPGGPLPQDVAGTATVGPAPTAAPVTATWPPFEAQHQPGVADLLASPPAAGERLEVDAYYGGAQELATMGGGPPPPGDQVACPHWPAILTDRPFAATLQYLNVSTSNMPPAGAPWLVAAVPEQTQPGSRVPYPTLPYHARLRGYLGEPAFAGCVSAERVFVVEQVVQVYEQDPPPDLATGLQAPADYAAWPRHADASYGYSLPYPPGWRAEMADERTLRITGPQWPERAVTVHVYDGETRYDQYESDPAKISPLLQGVGWGVFEQGWPAFAQAGHESQALAGHYVEREDAPPDARSVAVLFSGGGRTYELALVFPTGYAASQELLTGYTGIVAGFRLDADPGPTPTAPVRQDLGTGPFLTEAQALAAAEQRAGSPLELLAAALMPEAAARRQAEACTAFMGHPDGVWLLTVRGPYEGQTRTLRLFLDAVSGEQLCGEEIAPPAGTPLPPPPGAPTLAPTATP
ncbi:MAG: hypothetical protein IT318_10730 [Anaerolineales bacterium]|nr:hypothetical protein [Anaerolineales bacterium]